MTATTGQARDQISDVVYQAIMASSFSGIANDERLLWWNRPGNPPVVDAGNGNPQTWVSVVVRHVAGGQSTLAGDTDRGRTTRQGIVLIKCYEAFGTGNSELDDLTQMFETALRHGRTPGGVWFRRCRTVEFGQDGAWFRSDVLADFQYDDVI